MLVFGKKGFYIVGNRNVAGSFMRWQVDKVGLHHGIPMVFLIPMVVIVPTRCTTENRALPSENQ